MDRYDQFFSGQVGRGAGVGRIFFGAIYQRGHGGIGSFLAGALCRVLLLLSRGAKAVGKKGVHAGMSIISYPANRMPVKKSGEKLKTKRLRKKSTD